MKKYSALRLNERQKSFLLACLILTLPLCILYGVFGYDWWQRTCAENLEHYQSQWEQGIKEAENKLKKPQQFASQLSELEWFKQLLYSNHRHKTIGPEAYTLHQYNNDLKIYATLDQTLDSTFIFFPEREYILSTTALFYDDQVPGRIFRADNQSEAEWADIIGARHISEIIPEVKISSGNIPKEGLIWVTSFPFNSAQIRANLVIFIDYALIESSFPRELLAKEMELNIYHNERLLWSKDGESGKQEFGDGQKEGMIKQNDCYYFLRSVGMNSYRMSVPAWRIEDRRIIWIMFMGYLILLMLSAGAAWLMERFFLMPVNKIIMALGLRKGGKMHEDRYHWLENEIIDLIDKEKRLRDQVAKHKPYLMNSVLTAVIYGNRGKAESEQVFQMLGIDFKHRFFRILVMSPEADHGSVGMERYIKDLESDWTAECSIYYAFLKNGTAILLNADSIERLNRAEERLWGWVRRECPKSHCGAGDTVTEIWQINRSYRDAVRCQEYVYLLGTDCGFISAERVGSRTEVIENEKEELEQIRNFIKKSAHSHEPAKAAFCDFIDSLQVPQKLSVRKARELIEALAGQLMELSQELRGEHDHELLLLKRLNFAEDMRDLEVYIDRLSSYVETKYNSGGKKYLQEMVRFINDNIYDPNLSLNMLAEAMGYTPAYVSKIFKEYYNDNFLSYITNGRMTKAKELLSLSDLSVREVAEESGFNNDFSFRRVFRKVSGMTPSEFRALYRK